MNTSILEINENEYCIKLSKDTFNLNLVRQLIKRIQAEELFFSKKSNEDWRSNTSPEFEENFDHLGDK